MKRLVEIRSYKLKPGTAEVFHDAFRSTAVPMLRRWETDVVAFGPSLLERESYFLVRSYASIEDLDARQDAFYGSNEWREGPRESIVSRIESYLNTVLWLSPDSIDDLRRSNASDAQ